MIDDRSFETLIREALSRSGEPAPFDVDVADRIMARVAVSPAPVRWGLSGRQFTRWAAAAAVAGFALYALAAWKGLTLEGAVSTVGLAMAGLTTAATKLMGPASAVGNGFVRVATAVWGSAQTVVQPLAAFQPLVRVLLVVLTAGMLGITTVIVGRDVRSRGADRSQA